MFKVIAMLLLSASPACNYWHTIFVFLYITHLLASAILRKKNLLWELSSSITSFGLEYCLTVVIQDPRIDLTFVINAWSIAANNPVIITHCIDSTTSILQIRSKLYDHQTPALILFSRKLALRGGHASSTVWNFAHTHIWKIFQHDINSDMQECKT